MTDIFPITIKVENIKVNMKLVENPDSLERAIITVVCGPFKVAGFRIQKSHYPNKKGDYLWVQPPSYRGQKGKFHKVFWTEDKGLWAVIETLIWDKYYETAMKAELNKDDIPIIEDNPEKN